MLHVRRKDDDRCTTHLHPVSTISIHAQVLGQVLKFDVAPQKGYYLHWRLQSPELFDLRPSRFEEQIVQQHVEHCSMLHHRIGQMDQDFVEVNH